MGTEGSGEPNRADAVRIDFASVFAQQIDTSAQCGFRELNGSHVVLGDVDVCSRFIGNTEQPIRERASVGEDARRLGRPVGTYGAVDVDESRKI